MYLTIKDWPEGERPREKLLKHGAGTLGNAELLAILIGSGTRGKTALDLGHLLLCQADGINNLATLTPDSLRRVKGVGCASAARISAALELGRRLASGQVEKRQKLISPEAIAQKFGPALHDLRHEVFKVILLDGGNKLLRDVDITRGILNASLIHPREVFKVAVDNSAAAIVLMHNHPSGEINPSKEDISVTRQMTDAGRIMGIPVLDHIIIGRKQHYSFAQEGMLIN
ncbi:DNA repair protein RadC [bacterium]|nr:DNA repair protein RadC [bacterium]